MLDMFDSLSVLEFQNKIKFQGQFRILNMEYTSNYMNFETRTLS